MSDARRFVPAEPDCVAVERFVAERGGPAFFDGRHWKTTLAPLLANIRGQWETEWEQVATIEHELAAARDALEGRLGTRARHLCLPWGVAGTLTRSAIERLGFETAVANRMPGMYAVRHGDDPFFLKRLPNRYIFALPGRGRRPFLTLT